MFASNAMIAKGTTAHAFTFKSIEGGSLPFISYRGYVVMFVNTASFCGLAKQIEAL